VTSSSVVGNRISFRLDIEEIGAC